MKTVTSPAPWLVLSLLLGCATAPKAAAPEPRAAPSPTEQAPSSSSAPQELETAEPTSLAEAEALLAQAQAELERVAPSGGKAESLGAAAAAAPAPAPPPPAAASRRQERQDDEAVVEGAAEPAPKKEATGCVTTCKAFASLQRASEAVCRLDAQGVGERCLRARQIRESAARRVAGCGCEGSR